MDICFTWPDCTAGLQDAFPRMSSYSRQSFICSHKNRHQWKGFEADATGSAVQTSQGALSAMVALASFGGNQCSVIFTREEGYSWQWTSTSPCFGKPSPWQVAMPELLSELLCLSQGKFVQSLKGDGELCKSSSPPDRFCWSVAVRIVRPDTNVMNVVLTSALCMPVYSILSAGK